MYCSEMRRFKKYPLAIMNWLENPMSEDIDYELISELISYICNNKDDGAILVFLSGWDQISKLTKILKDKGFGNTCKVFCINVKFHNYKYFYTCLHVIYFFIF